jgi:ribosomal protein S18 acetylase RimI-like enzyme
MRAVRTFLLVIIGALIALAIAPPPSDASAASTQAHTISAATEGHGSAASSAQARDQAWANRLLSALQTDYRHLDGVTVRFGVTPGGEEAVAYYRTGEILVSASHTVGVREILGHEIWHVIDWRDNGRIDWGEEIPPVNSADYAR